MAASALTRWHRRQASGGANVSSKLDFTPPAAGVRCLFFCGSRGIWRSQCQTLDVCGLLAAGQAKDSLGAGKALDLGLEEPGDPRLSSLPPSWETQVAEGTGWGPWAESLGWGPHYADEEIEPQEKRLPAGRWGWTGCWWGARPWLRLGCMALRSGAAAGQPSCGTHGAEYPPSAPSALLGATVGAAVPG